MKPYNDGVSQTPVVPPAPEDHSQQHWKEKPCSRMEAARHAAAHRAGTGAVTPLAICSTLLRDVTTSKTWTSDLPLTRLLHVLPGSDIIST